MTRTSTSGPAARDPRRTAACLASLAALTLLAACGGGDSPAPPPPPPPPPPASSTQLSGIAAVGAALAGASITVTDADAGTADPAAVVSAADGRYTVDVTGLQAPLLVRASGSVDGQPVVHWAVVPAVSGGGNTANVTPLTSAIAALVAPGGDPAALAPAPSLAANGTAARVGNATTLLLNTLNSDGPTAALLGGGFQPLSTAFTANGEGIDLALDRLHVAWSAGGVTVTNQVAPVTADGAPAAVTLTAAQAATPGTAPPLPASAAASDLPTAADLAALGARLEACLALPVASRVTLDAAGTVTAVSATCNFAPADWRSNGRNWAQDLGQFTFAKNLLSGARVGRGVVALALAPEGRTAPHEFKHPYCNDGPCVVVRYPLTTAGGRATSLDWVLGRVADEWNFVGNQRPFRAFVEPRLYRKINSNRSGAGSGSTVNPYFLADRFESALRLNFDLSVADTAGVRAVRVTGPGLPSAGMVLFRSQACGTADRMGISQQNGSTRVVGTSTFQMWTFATGNDVFIDAANLDGSALAMPVPVISGSSASFQTFAPAPVADAARVIPAWASHKWEVFHYDTPSDEPDLVFYTRTSVAAENAAAGTGKAWPELAPELVSSLLVPGASGAGALSGLAHSVSWSLPGSQYVGSGYVFGANFATATNVQGETAGYGLRTLLYLEPTAYGDLSASGWRHGDIDAGTSLSSVTQTMGSNPNPRCEGRGNEVVALTSNVNDYREIGLFTRDSQRRQQAAVWFWDN